jgi:hypothetical protein
MAVLAEEAKAEIIVDKSRINSEGQCILRAFQSIETSTLGVRFGFKLFDGGLSI